MLLGGSLDCPLGKSPDKDHACSVQHGLTNRIAAARNREDPRDCDHDGDAVKEVQSSRGLQAREHEYYPYQPFNQEEANPDSERTIVVGIRWLPTKVAKDSPHSG